MELLKEIRSIDSSPKKLREFGFVVGGVCLALGAALAYFKGHNYVPYLCVGLALVIPAIVAPQILSPLQKPWMALALCMGWFMSRVLMSVLFFVIITPLSFVLKLKGKRFLDHSAKYAEGSWWIRKPEAENAKSASENQF